MFQGFFLNPIILSTMGFGNPVVHVLIYAE